MKKTNRTINMKLSNKDTQVNIDTIKVIILYREEDGYDSAEIARETGKKAALIEEITKVALKTGVYQKYYNSMYDANGIFTVNMKKRGRGKMEILKEE